jgi:alkanesulfonate monooxygenase SsuD/methylene tetrahydromethanopterin reductase-like flavin-dependent oxidoreductase (luciferase family)
MLGGVLPVNFIGGPDTIVEQIKQCRDQVGAGVIDLMFQTPVSSDPVDALMHRLELFGEKILSRIRDV